MDASLTIARMARLLTPRPTLGARARAAFNAWRDPSPIRPTPGVDLRVTFDDVLLVDADSDLLYFFGKYGGLATIDDGWFDVLWAHSTPQSKRIIRVEVRPRKLP